MATTLTPDLDEATLRELRTKRSLAVAIQTSARTLLGTSGRVDRTTRQRLAGDHYKLHGDVVALLPEAPDRAAFYRAVPDMFLQSSVAGTYAAATSLVAYLDLLTGATCGCGHTCTARTA